jgi:agmatinase
MSPRHPVTFLDLPPCPLEKADAVIVPVPFERTVSYGGGTMRGPAAIIAASCQIETFDEETLVDFERSPLLHTMAPPEILGVRGAEDSLPVTDQLDALRDLYHTLRPKLVVALGGEHTLSYGAAAGLIDDLTELTIVQIDAHADLIDELDGRRWSHGTVMRRLWEQGCRLVQIGVRSLSRSEYELATTGQRIDTFFAHQLEERWTGLLATLADLRGPVYVTLDVDGLDPSVIPSTGTPQPGGLTWTQTLSVFRAVASNRACRLLGADVVEFVPSPHPPGCDLTAAKLVVKLLAYWAKARQ